MSAGVDLARWLTLHERYDAAALEAERFPTPAQLSAWWQALRARKDGAA